MTTTSTAPAGPGALFEWPAALSSMPWAPGVPWELATQALTLQSTLWLAAATLQARWLSDGADALVRMPGWMVWHNGTEQLA